MSDKPSNHTRALNLPIALAALVVGVELTMGLRYGLFRDELYYLACADHLDWGYVDHPPLSIAILALVRAWLGDSQLALRIVPALAGGSNVVIAAAIARELGGGRFASMIAALSIAVAPLYLAIAGFYSMNPLDVLAWAVATLLLTRLTARDDARVWPWLGAALGIGLLNKISVLFFVAGLGLAVLATPSLRTHLKTYRPWLALGITLTLFAPYVWWQVTHGWPTLEFIHNASVYKNLALSPLGLLLAQLELLHPFNLPLWLGGLAWLLFGEAGRRFRALAIVWLTVFVILAFQGAKGYYLGPSFMLLLPAGAVGFERLLKRHDWRWPRVVAPSALLLGGAALSPFALPVLPIDRFIAYQRTLGLAPRQEERSALGPLPQLFADRFGWHELTTSVAEAIANLPAHERAQVLLIASNYGEASALNYFGRPYHLPPAVSTHNSYFLWGPGRSHANVVVHVGASLDDLRALFETCALQPRTASVYAMPYESTSPIVVCRGLKLKLEDAWIQNKQFI